MNKLFFLLLFPLFLYSKTYITVYFPLEENLVNKITLLNDTKINVMTSKFTSKYKKLKYSEISKFANVDIFYHFGLDIEKKYELELKKINPNLLVVDLSKGIKKINNNPYIWMDPLLLRDVTKNIYNSLVLLDNKNENKYKDNYERLLDEFDNYFLKIKKTMDRSQIYSLIVYDDYWAYFAKRFGIQLYKRKKKYIKAKEINSLVAFIKKNEIKALLTSKKESYTLSLSLARNGDIPIFESDIFTPYWDLNIIELSNYFKKE